MVIVYYTQPFFLDSAIETIQCLKKKVTLHLMIEISPDSKKSTIIDIDQLDLHKPITSAEEVLGKEKWKEMQKYFEGVASVHFVIHTCKKSLCLKSFFIALRAGKFIHQLRPDVVHFDSVQTRTIGLYPYLRNKKIFITVHDPVPHSGESSWKVEMPNIIFYRLAVGFFFYSEFSKSLFKKHYPANAELSHVLRLQPYSFISQFANKFQTTADSILFFGRMSFYKGIDLLLNAIPVVLQHYPAQKFIIAGNMNGLTIDPDFLKKYEHNVQFIPEHLPVKELAYLINSAKFVVCPYRDATQSGVLMTSYALRKPVVATNVGGFPEYVKDHVNGLLAPPTEAGIASTILDALNDDKYKLLASCVDHNYCKVAETYNENCLLKAYSN